MPEVATKWNFQGTACTVLSFVVVRASDTDILIILLGMLGRDLLSERARGYRRILMDCRSGNTCRHIDVTQIATALKSKQKGLAAAIPGLHAFTGSDFTTAFYRKGKVKTLENVGERYQRKPDQVLRQLIP